MAGADPNSSLALSISIDRWAPGWTRRLAVLSILGMVLVGACAPLPAPPATVRTTSGNPVLPRITPAPSVSGDPENGRRLFMETRVGCTTCHSLRGVPTANGVIGPNLTNVALRPTLVGELLPNTPENMRRWVTDPTAVKADTLMRLGVQLNEQEVRDITAFLYSQPFNPI